MEIISLKMDEHLLNAVDKNLSKNNFSTRTEFIRTAIREKLADLSRDELIKEFLKFRGSAKKKTTYKENRRTREAVSKELMAELDKKFS